MKILNVICCYNEINYLPYVVKYYQHQDIDIFVLDNYSNDETWDWLQNNGIACERFDTDGAFDVVRQQNLRLEKYEELKPDWVIYGDADEFIITYEPIRDVIAKADKKNNNIIRLRKFDFRYTGEKREKRDPRSIYYYYEENYQEFGGIQRIHKNTKDISYSGDFIDFPDKKILDVKGFVLNYGGTKDKENGKDLLKRRKKAWEKGLNKVYGWHYLDYEKRDWFWDKNKLLDIRKHEIWPYMNQNFKNLQKT